MNRTNGLNNHGLIGFRWQIMKEQNEDLEKLEETVTSTKHIALAVRYLGPACGLNGFPPTGYTIAIVALLSTLNPCAW
ncbi:syntaxin-52-like [Quercus lobata]|uniref:syntaxin-52-like n=1 Tax=Quercus lobata TaxID=97700 RepID=UPI001247BBE7|nr:syntaxin-52-like [Quercus lobata]